MSIANVSTLFQDSNALSDFASSFHADMETQDVLLAAQLAVNQFLADLGSVLKTDFRADTYLMYHTIFSTDTEKHFAIAAVLLNTATGSQEYVIFPFLLLLANVNKLSSQGTVLEPGIYYVPNLNGTHVLYK